MAVITHDLELLFKVCTSALMVGRDGCKKVDLRVPGSSESVLRFMGCVR